MCQAERLSIQPARASLYLQHACQHDIGLAFNQGADGTRKSADAKSVRKCCGVTRMSKTAVGSHANPHPRHLWPGNDMTVRNGLWPTRRPHRSFPNTRQSRQDRTERSVKSLWPRRVRPMVARMSPRPAPPGAGSTGLLRGRSGVAPASHKGLPLHPFSANFPACTQIIFSTCVSRHFSARSVPVRSPCRVHRTARIPCGWRDPASFAGGTSAPPVR